jgi:hypothetical protein
MLVVRLCSNLMVKYVHCKICRVDFDSTVNCQVTTGRGRGVWRFGNEETDCFKKGDQSCNLHPQLTGVLVPSAALCTSPSHFSPSVRSASQPVKVLRFWTLFRGQCEWWGTQSFVVLTIHLSVAPI